jgi:UDP-glucose 4-epimerase
MKFQTFSNRDSTVSENLIIVGRRGYVGGYLTEFAKENGHKVISISSKDCNFRNSDEVERFFRSLDDSPYTIIFLAAIIRSKDDTIDTFYDNLEIIKNLARYQNLANIQSIIHFSSADVYGDFPDLPISETSKIQPATWYGIAKYVGEFTLLSSGTVQCPVTVLRLPGVYGKSPNDNSLIGKFIRTMRDGNPVIINGNGETLRDYVYIEDLCNILECLLPLRYHGAINVATGTSEPIIHIVNQIGSVLGMEPSLAKEPPDDDRGYDLSFDIDLLRTMIPDYKFLSLGTGISSYL